MPDIPSPIRKIEEIQKELGSSWVQLPGFYSLSVADVTSNGVGFNLGKGIVLVAFLNIKNGEVKTYVARLLDVPNREYLF